MDLVLSIVASIAAVVVFIQGVTLIVIAVRLVKLPLWASLTQAVSRDSVPADVLAVLDDAQVMLEQQGFRYTHMRKIRSHVASAAMSADYCAVYHHAVHDVHAQVHVASMPTPRWPFDIYLCNSFRDGRSLLTVNGLAHLLIPFPRAVTVNDCYAPDFDGQLAAHLKAREGFPRERIDASEMFSIDQAMAAMLLKTLEEERQAYRQGGAGEHRTYGLRLIAAMKMAWRMRRGMASRKRMEAGGKQPDLRRAESPSPVRHAAEKIAFARTLGTLHSLRAPRWFRWLAFAVTAAGFIALGSWWWGVAAALTIAGVVAVHEAGHWLAMKLAGFRDVQVFFVPGMGAATSGEKHDANPLTHLLVYLAGPLPGLVLSMAAYAWIAFGSPDVSSTWFQVLAVGAMASFAINFLNLLPVLPLDGGRIIDLFIVARLPWLRFVFALGSGGLLLYSGFTTEDNVLRALGILFLFGASHHYRLARASAGLLRSMRGKPLLATDFQNVAGELHHLLSQPQFGKWNYSTRLNVGLALLPRLLGRLPGIRETALGLGIYVASIVLPLTAAIALFVVEPDNMRAALARGFSADIPEESRAGTVASATDGIDAYVKTMRDERESRLATATPEQRLAVLRDLTNDAGEAEDYADALRLAKLYYAQAAESAPSGRERADAAKSLALAIGAETDLSGERGAEYDRLLLEAEGLLRPRLSSGDDRDDTMLLAEVLGMRAERVAPEEELPLRQEIVDLHANYAGPGLPYARRSLARALDRAGRTDAAETELRTAVADAKKQNGVSTPYLVAGLISDHGWFLVSHGRFDEANSVMAPLRTPANSASSIPSSYRRDLHLAAAFAARSQGDWHTSRAEAIAAQARQDDYPESDSWLVRLISGDLLARRPLYADATLMVIDAERALGENARADQLAAELRKQYSRHAGGNLRCRFHPAENWRAGFMRVLQESEKRELRCVTD